MNRRTNMVSNSSGNQLPPVAPPYGAITQSTQGKGQINQANSQPNHTAASSSGPRCFKCGEAGHRMADCKKGGWYGKGLFIESEECTDDHLNTFEQEAVYDAEEEEEYVQGDDGPLLVTRRACFTPCKSEGEDWLQSNIFQTTCTMGGKVCRLVIDSGSCENVVSEEAVQKLGLATEKRTSRQRESQEHQRRL